MNGSSHEPLGVSGGTEVPPDQGVACSPALAGEAKRQSCLPQGRSHQFRIRLPDAHTKKWLALPPGIREKAIAVTLGAAAAQVDLQRLPDFHRELVATRDDIHNALLLATSSGVRLDANRIHAALDRIDAILGGRP